jgi:hypothetical protein
MNLQNVRPVQILTKLVLLLKEGFKMSSVSGSSSFIEDGAM